ncbi:Dipeptidyl peptidase 4 [Rhodotorula kratochvilovae]
MAPYSPLAPSDDVQPLLLPDPLSLLHRPTSFDSDSSFETDRDADEHTLYDRTPDEDTATDDDKEHATLLAEGKLLDPESGRRADADDVDDGWDPLGGAQKSRRRRLFLLVPACILGFLFLTFLASAVFSASTGRHRFRGHGLKHITREELANGTFWSEGVELEWVAEAGDGVFSQRTEYGSILLTDLNANSSRTLVKGDDVVDENGDKLGWSRFKLSADMQYILFDSEWTKVWRHSTLANFYLHPLPSSSSSSSAQKTLPLLPPSSPPRTSLARFSPTSHHLAYVHEHDLYVLPAGSWETGAGGPARAAVRITSDGGGTVFNGAPDWVYEEEIFGGDEALWWSPASDHLAFLSFDETDVPEYDYPVYNTDAARAGGEAYPEKVTMRYPKPGFPNPRVTLRVFSLATYLASPSRSVSAATHMLVLARPFPAEDVLVTQVAWVGRDELVVKATDRTGRVERVGYFDLRGAKEGEEVVGRVVRETDWEKLDGGWAEAEQQIVGIASSVLLASSSPASASAAPIPSYPPGYLDVLPNPQGYNHLAYFSPADASEPVWLTSGEWEIDGGIERVDVRRGLVYFIAANPSVSRQVYTVPLPSSSSALAALRSGKAALSPPRALSVDAKGKEEELAHYGVSVSPGGGVYQLNYEGPGVPWQKLFKADDPDFSLTLANNSRLAALDAQYAHAQITHSRLALPGTKDALGAGTGAVELNVQELRPPLMDESGKTKYPVLFQVYGGPNSQMATTRFQRDWQHYLAVSLGYVVVRVDPRGTGFRGRRFRTTVRRRLGEVEAQDVVAAAREWAKRKYVDEKRVGIWGWSYGGFLTSKVVETNSSVFQLGMAVAPVSDWRFYDSVYTERYMSTPEDNPVGYANATVARMAGFKNADFALAHGSGDDNVHFQNTANLLDRFTISQVRGFRFRMFTDSDHSIQTRGAYWELMAWLEGFLLERFGEGGRTKSRWKLKIEHDAVDPAMERARDRERERE